MSERDIINIHNILGALQSRVESLEAAAAAPPAIDLTAIKEDVVAEATASAAASVNAAVAGLKTEISSIKLAIKNI